MNRKYHCRLHNHYPHAICLVSNRLFSAYQISSVFIYTIEKIVFKATKKMKGKREKDGERERERAREEQENEKGKNNGTPRQR